MGANSAIIGTVDIQAGSIYVSSGSGLLNAANIKLSGAAASLSLNADATVAKLEGATSTAQVNISGASTRTLTVAQSSNTTYAGKFVKSGTASVLLSKSSTGTLLLTGDNSGMLGAAGNSTTVSGGKLIGGSANAFGGGGSFANTVNVGGAGTIGSSTGATVLIGGNLSLASGSKFAFDLAGGNTTLSVAGNQLGAFNYTVDLTGLTGAGSYTLMSVAGATKAALGFTGGTLNNGVGGYTWTSIGWSGNDLVGIVAVPEPGTCALFGIGSAMVLFGYRRNRRKI